MTAAMKMLEEETSSLVEQRFERIGKTMYAMSSPGYKHQIVAGRLFAQLDAQLSVHNCLPVVAPFDVYLLYDQGDENTLVQPDVFLACDKAKLEENCYTGAPKFIIEILSSNRSHDMVTKLNLYQKAEVEEYWMIDPDEKIVTVLELSNGGYIYHSCSGETEVSLITVPGCTVDFCKVFEGMFEGI